MLMRILDTSGIDIKDPEIHSELHVDLRRMDHMPHERAPLGVDAYRVEVTPSTQTYFPGLHRFRFKIQYGKINGDEFEPTGEPVFYQTETLPMLDN